MLAFYIGALWAWPVDRWINPYRERSRVNVRLEERLTTGVMIRVEGDADSWRWRWQPIKPLDEFTFKVEFPQRPGQAVPSWTRRIRANVEDFDRDVLRPSHPLSDESIRGYLRIAGVSGQESELKSAREALVLGVRSAGRMLSERKHLASTHSDMYVSPDAKPRVGAVAITSFDRELLWHDTVVFIGTLLWVLGILLFIFGVWTRSKRRRRAKGEPSISA